MDNGLNNHLQTTHLLNELARSRGDGASVGPGSSAISTLTLPRQKTEATPLFDHECATVRIDPQMRISARGGACPNHPI
jgi:hypothetical protein